MSGSRPDYRLVRPFSTELVIPVGGFDRVRAPVGWVFGDIYIIIPNTNGLRWCAASDRELNNFRGITAADKELGSIPLAIDFSVGGGWFPGLMDWRWKDIGFAEIRCIYADQDAFGWQDGVISVWGNLVPDPRRYD